MLFFPKCKSNTLLVLSTEAKVRQMLASLPPFSQSLSLTQLKVYAKRYLR